MKHVDLMLDLETFATGSDACIVQIGACYFDRVNGEIFETFKVNVQPHSPGNGRIDGQTVQWWLGQSEAARNSILATPQQPISRALQDFRTFADRANAVWSHATFDFVIVQESLRRLGLRTFKYTMARDIRTLVDLSGPHERVERDGLHHDALEDAKFQVKYCVQALNKLKEYEHMYKGLEK